LIVLLGAQHYIDLGVGERNDTLGQVLSIIMFTGLCLFSTWIPDAAAANPLEHKRALPGREGHRSSRLFRLCGFALMPSLMKRV